MCAQRTACQSSLDRAVWVVLGLVMAEPSVSVLEGFAVEDNRQWPGLAI